MTTSTDIKFYVHTNKNAPQLQNAYGSMINVLDACLVDGINIEQVTSLTAFESEVTATFGAVHNLLSGQVVKITGASQEEFNGEYRIDVKTTTSFTYKLNKTPASSVATGVISCSLAPLGWEKAFSSSNAAGGGKAAYRSVNQVLTTRPYLRVVDEIDPAWTTTYAKYAKVGLVETISSIDVFGGFQAPFDQAMPDKNWSGSGSGASAYNGWAKWHYAVTNGIRNMAQTQTQTQNDSNTPANGFRQWFIIGNSDFFYVLNSVVPTDGQYLFYGCGAIEKNSQTEEDAWFLASDLVYGTASSTYRLYEYNNLAYSLGYDETPTILLYKTSNRLNSDRCYLASIKTSRVRDATFYSGALHYALNSGSFDSQPLTPPTMLGLESGVRVLGHPPRLRWTFRDKPFEECQLLASDKGVYLAKNVTAGLYLGQVVFELEV